MESLMSAATSTTFPAGVYTTPAFGGTRVAGSRHPVGPLLRSRVHVYDYQPRVGASADELADFCDGDRMRF